MTDKSVGGAHQADTLTIPPADEASAEFLATLLRLAEQVAMQLYGLTAEAYGSAKDRRDIGDVLTHLLAADAALHKRWLS